MSKKSERHEAERLGRRAAYLNRLNQPSQTQKLLETAGTTHAAELKTTASPAQYAANKANAQLSTGPITPEGKAISARNHTSHGLTANVTVGGAFGEGFKVLPTESQADYDAQLAAYIREWTPETATEIDLVTRMATHSWLRERARRLQDASLEQAMAETPNLKQFEVFGRYYTLHMRAFNKALADLMRLKGFQFRQQKEALLAETRAQAAQIRFESQKQKAEAHAAKMESIRLRQEAQKQRNNRRKTTESLVEQLTEATETAIAA